MGYNEFRGEDKTDSDLAFTNRIVVQPFDDGTFRYLSNSIEEKELQVPTVTE